LQVAEQSLRSGLTPVVGPNRRQRRYVPDQPVRLRIGTLPGAKDPDELIRADPGQWPGLVQAARPVIDFVLDRLAQRYDLTSGQGKAAAADEVTEILAAIADPIEQAHYVQQVAHLLGVGEEAVHRALRRQRSSASPAPAAAAPPRQHEGDKDDEYALALVLRLRDLNVPLETREMDFTRDENRALLRTILAGQPPSDELRPYLERARARLPEVEGYSVQRLTTELALTRLWLEERALERRQAELSAAMKSAPPAEHEELADSLLAIGRRLAEIEQRRRDLVNVRRPPVEAA
jgi:DNA primase